MHDACLLSRAERCVGPEALRRPAAVRGSLAAAPQCVSDFMLDTVQLRVAESYREMRGVLRSAKARTAARHVLLCCIKGPSIFLPICVVRSFASI